MKLALPALTLCACASASPTAQPSPAKPSAEEARQFVASANLTLKRLYTESQTADWIKNTYITDDTERNAAAANDRTLAFTSEATRSMLVKPRDREVVCHASAWDVTSDDDLRIKVCIPMPPREQDLTVLHHELGHDYYFHAYYKLPMLYQGGAHDGFHEAIGDTLILSLTPGYLKQLGLVSAVPDDEKAVVNVQMKRALARVAFLPFAKLIDRWRWDVFSGKTSPADYVKAWWALREQTQGVSAPIARSEQDFDPGAKYHVPANVPYTRYFLSYILQFQFYRAMCQAAGHRGPLYQCSFYGSKEAGARLWKMLSLGQSRPWPDALQAMTGQRQMDASAVLEYFQPLQAWLKTQNQGRKCGW